MTEPTHNPAQQDQRAAVGTMAVLAPSALPIGQQRPFPDPPDPRPPFPYPPFPPRPNPFQDGNFVIGAGPEVYLMAGGLRRWVPDPVTLKALSPHNPWPVITVQQSRLDAVPRGADIPSRVDGRVYRGASAPEVWVVRNLVLHHIPDAQTLVAEFGGWAGVVVIDQSDCDAIPKGAPVPSVVGPPSPEHAVTGFRPSTNGCHFDNSLTGPDLTFTVLPFGQINIGDASRGVCGGMAFVVRDYHEAHRAMAPDTTPPSQGTPLFDFVSSRLIDSFDIPAGIAEYMAWMATPEHDTHPIFTRRGVSWMTIEQQWPIVKATIDAGHLCPIGLVTLLSVNPGDLGRNHVVTAYGYSVSGPNLTIWVYDPNTPNGDDVTLRMDTSAPESSTPIASSVNIGDPVRGFFVLAYSPKSPPA